MDDRHGRDDGLDEAVFAPARLSARGRPPIVVASVALVIVGLVGAAALGRLDGDLSAPGDALPMASTAAAVAAGSHVPARPPSPAGPRLPEARRELMKLDLQPNGRLLFVHGDVFSLEAFIVVISLEDQGVVTATRTVSMPGGSTAFLTEANPRFQAHFDLPTTAPAGSVWVRANAYDTHGDLILSLRQPLLAEIG